MNEMPSKNFTVTKEDWERFTKANLASRALKGEPEKPDRGRPWWVPDDDVLRAFAKDHHPYLLVWMGVTIHVYCQGLAGKYLIGTVQPDNHNNLTTRPPVFDGEVFKGQEHDAVCFDAVGYVVRDISARNAWPKQEPKNRHVFQVSVTESAAGEWSVFADCYGEVLNFYDRPTSDMIVASLFKVGYDATYVRIVFYPSEKKRDWIPGERLLYGFKRKIGDSWYLLERNGDRIDIVQRTENVVGCLHAPSCGSMSESAPFGLLGQVIDYCNRLIP